MVQTGNSLSADSPVLLITEEEYQNILQGEKCRVEVPQPAGCSTSKGDKCCSLEQQQELPRQQVWDKLIERLTQDWVVDSRMHPLTCHLSAVPLTCCLCGSLAGQEYPTGSTCPYSSLTIFFFLILTKTSRENFEINWIIFIIVL